MAAVTGFTHIYTGNGKGKTTAAMGLALRALGAGFTVYIAQFLKKGEYSEIKALKRFGKKDLVEQFGTGQFIRQRPKPRDILYAQKGFDRVKKAVLSGQFDIIILDELNLAVHYGLVTLEAVLQVICDRTRCSEIVITGRNAPKKLLAAADLVTEMKERKHYFSKGIHARAGIER